MDIETITKHLNAIKRTSLFCGSNERLATRIGVPSIANNNNFEKVGSDKRIATFESFNKEYQEYTHSMKAELMDFMEEYYDTSEFYKNNELGANKSISSKEAILDIIGCIFFSQGLPKDRKVCKFISTIYDHETDTLTKVNVNIPLLILIIYKIIPTYTSRSGIVSDICQDYAKVKELLSECYERFGVTEDKVMLEIFEERFDVTDDKTMPGEIEEEIRKKEGKHELNRMALITLFESVINNIYNTANTGSILDYSRNFDIKGIWIDRQNKDIVYEIEESNPYYQMTVCHLGKATATYALYGLVIHESSDRRLIFETTHPRGRARKLLNEKIGILDMSSHYVKFDNQDCPQVIELEDISRHHNYDFNASKLFRASEQEEEALTRRIESLELKDKFEKYRSEYIPDSDLIAITHKFLYISSPSLTDGQLYRIPRERYSDKGIRSINIDDACGECIIARQGPYIRFEKIDLTIDIRTDEKIREAGIVRVRPNEII